MRAIKCLAKLLVIIGALNWGLIGFFQYDLVANIFGGMMMTGARVVYSIVGLAGLYMIACWVCCCRNKSCGSCGCGCKNGSCNCNSKGCGSSCDSSDKRRY